MHSCQVQKSEKQIASSSKVVSQRRTSDCAFQHAAHVGLRQVQELSTCLFCVSYPGLPTCAVSPAVFRLSTIWYHEFGRNTCSCSCSSHQFLPALAGESEKDLLQESDDWLTRDGQQKRHCFRSLSSKSFRYG